MTRLSARLKVFVAVAALITMLGFVTYLPAFLPQSSEQFPPLSLKLSRSPSQVVNWLKEPEAGDITSNGIRFSEKAVDGNGVTFFIETFVRGVKIRYKANLVDIEQRGRENFDLLGYIVDELGKESFFRAGLSEDLSSTRVQLKFFQTDYDSTELSLLYRQAYNMGLR